MTRAMMELGFGLYLMAGVELAEWGLCRTDVRQYVRRIGPGRGYLLMIAIGPLWVLWVLWVGMFMMVIAVNRGVLCGRHLISGERIRFWTIVIVAAAVLILKMASPVSL